MEGEAIYNYVLQVSRKLIRLIDSEGYLLAVASRAKITVSVVDG